MGQQGFGEKYGPWALVTGASSGMGSHFARRLAEKRLNLILVARREDRLRALATELEEQGSIETKVVAADLSADDFLPKLTAATQDLEVGLLVNNAGFGLTGEFLANDLQTEIEVLHLNCRAPLVLTHAYGKHMQNRRRGGIIFVSSIVGFVGVPTWSQYAATKGYDVVLAEGLAEELKKSGVDVLAVCPGFTRTDFLRKTTTFGRIVALDPDAVVRTALRNLGKRPRVTAGNLFKVILLTTRFQPRWLNTKIFKMVLDRVRQA